MMVADFLASIVVLGLPIVVWATSREAAREYPISWLWVNASLFGGIACAIAYLSLYQLSVRAMQGAFLVLFGMTLFLILVEGILEDEDVVTVPEGCPTIREQLGGK